MKAVYIEWVDSATRGGWSQADGGEPTLCKSVGIEVSRCKQSITISTSFNGGALYVDQMTIPMVAVKKIRSLKL